MDPDPYNALAASLRERLAVIADREFYQRDPAGHLEKLRSVSEDIVTRGNALPKPVDPRLAHFLHGCSYDKALAWLESR